MGGKAEGGRRPGFDLAGFGRQDPTTTDAIVWAEAEPGGKVRGGGKGRQLGGKGGEEGREGGLSGVGFYRTGKAEKALDARLRGHDGQWHDVPRVCHSRESGNPESQERQGLEKKPTLVRGGWGGVSPAPGEVYAQEAVEFRAQVGVDKADLVALGRAVGSGSWGQGDLGRIKWGGELRQEPFALPVRLGKEGRVVAVSGEGLRPGEELRFAPIPAAGFRKGLSRSLDVAVGSSPPIPVTGLGSGRGTATGLRIRCRV